MERLECKFENKWYTAQYLNKDISYKVTMDIQTHEQILEEGKEKNYKETFQKNESYKTDTSQRKRL